MLKLARLLLALLFATTGSLTPAQARMAFDSYGTGRFTIPSAALSPNRFLAPLLTIVGAAPAAVVGTAYSFTPTILGGYGAKTVALTGTLPAGLSFSTSTGAITGTPTAAGTASLSAKVTDALGLNATLAFSLTVNAGAVAANGPAPSSPNLLASPSDLRNPPWYPAPDFLAGPADYSIANGNTAQFFAYQEISVTAGQPVTWGFSTKRTAGSGPGQLRASFYKVGDASSTIAPSQTITDGAQYRSSITITPNFTGQIRLYVEVPPGANNGQAGRIYNAWFGSGTVDGWSAADAEYIASGGSPPVTAPSTGSFVSFGPLSNAKARSSVHPNIGAQSFVLDATFSTPSAFTAETQIIGAWGDNFYGQNEWLVSIPPNGRPQLAWTDGSNFTILQPTNSLPTSSVVSLRIKANTAAGSAEFFTVNSSGVESSLGLASGGSARSVRFDATNGMVQIGQSTNEQALYTGNFYAASLRIAGALALNPVAANGAISDSTGALWPITAADPTQLWNTAPNWPTEAPPTGPVTLAAGLSMAAGATNISTYDYRSDVGNIKTRAKLNATHYLHSMFGNINQVTGLPMDGLDQSYARYRSYAETNPFDLHKLSPQGVTLGVVSKGNTGTGGPGEWYAGLLRYQENFLPGMTLEWIGTGTVHDLGWMPGWLEQGYQASPGRVASSNSDPFAPGLLQAYIRTDNAANSSDDPYYEHDGPDNYSVSYLGAGWEMGKVLTSKLIRRGTDDDPVTMVVPPYTDFVANSNGFLYAEGTADVRLTGGARFNDGQMHVYTMNWLPDGTMEYFYDGKLYLRQHQEFRTQNFVDPIDGQTKQLGMHWMHGGQGIPRFGLGAAGSSVTIADRSQLAMTLQSVRMHKGNLSRTGIVEATNGVPQLFTPLTLSAATVAGGNFTTQVSSRAEESWVVATTANGQTAVLKNRPPQPPDVNGVAQPRPPTPLVFTFTGSSSVALPITLKEYPWATTGAAFGRPRTSVVNTLQ